MNIASMGINLSTRPLRRIAMLSVHGCPMAMPGMRFAGGMNMYLKRVAPLIAERGICVDVFTRGHQAGGQEIVELGPHARVVHLPAGSPELVKSEVVPYLPEFLDRLQEFIAEEGLGYDLVHSHYWLSGWVGERAARGWGIPHVVSFHTLAGVKELMGASDEPPERKAIEEEIASDADCVFTFTRDEVSGLHRLFGVPEERCHIVPGGVDLGLFCPRDRAGARARLGIAPDAKAVLFAGRVEPFKGPDILVRALAAMRDRRAVRLIFVGGSADERSGEWIQGLAEAEGVSGNITWHEAVPQSDLVDFYAAADVCAVPSYHETFGFAALESMACGTPVVAARVGALPSLVIDGVTGLLVDGHDPTDFARCLEGLLNDPPRRERMGRAARTRAMEFPWDRTVGEAIRGYERALHGYADRPQVTTCSSI